MEMKNKHKIKTYEPPEIEITLFEQADIVTASIPDGPYDHEGNMGMWT